MFLSADQLPVPDQRPGQAFVDLALADHGRTLPLRQTALMAGTAAQKGVDSTTVIFVESTFPQMDGVPKIGSAPPRQTNPEMRQVSTRPTGSGAR